MMYISFFPLLLLIRGSIAGYVLLDDYNATTFFDKFDFFTGEDPTQGAVQFVNRSAAQSSGLISTTGTSTYLGVDSKTVTPNRPSVRIESKNSYNMGLFIADITHMPGGVCGSWPAFWTIGPDWPNNGEIDIIEGVNSATTNAMTLHTAEGCSISNTASSFAGDVKTTNCWTQAPGQGTNVGCGIDAVEDTTYGSAFNAAAGGVYATEWTASGITIWFFPRSQIPSDITSGSPNPASWTKPQARFEGNCNFQKAFQNHSIVIDTTFCGQWAGQQAVWSSDPICSTKAATCQDYVMNNPADFAQAYWQFNSIKVYQLNDGFIGSQTQPAPSSTSTTFTALTSSTIARATTTVQMMSTSTTFTTLTRSITNSSTPLQTSTAPATSTLVMTTILTIHPVANQSASPAPAILPSSSPSHALSSTKSASNGYIGAEGSGQALGGPTHSTRTMRKSASKPSAASSDGNGFIGQGR